MKNEISIKASTLSVIHAGAPSVLCYVAIGEESANLTLRFDRGNRATLCGYPQAWDVHDVNIDAYDHDSPTGEEMYSAHGDIDGQVYISKQTERAILHKLKKCVENQFVDIAWVESCPPLREKLAILNKIERAIRSLK